MDFDIRGVVKLILIVGVSSVLKVIKINRYGEFLFGVITLHWLKQERYVKLLQHRIVGLIFKTFLPTKKSKKYYSENVIIF